MTAPDDTENVRPLFPSQRAERASDNPVAASARLYAEAGRHARIARDAFMAALAAIAADAGALAGLEALPPGQRDLARRIAERAAADLATLEALKSRA